MFRTGLASNDRKREGRKTECQPLPTNAEHSTELQGMARAVADFNRSVGISSEDPGKTLQWIRGDGASYALLLNLSTYLGPTGTFKNVIATPELWHTGATDLNSTAANHYGPSTSKDPSIELETDDLRDFFNDPKTFNPFPDFECLLRRAGMLVDKYPTQSAIQASLTLKDSTDRNRESKVKVGSAWTAETTTTDDDSEPPGLSEIEEPDTPRNASVPLPSKAPDDAPKVHEEKEGFTGDRAR
ncbi:hypothetical protein B0H14DRAFT_3740883 [Mycena olivaceomarginata]|nr:hypothetical protein B0H14DRAFT_3740883 [Mycena olivaceomarginata]